MPDVFLDVETYSEADLSKVGSPVYAAHPSTELLMCAWAVEDGPVSFWDATADPDIPAELAALLDDDDVTIRAHNAAFEGAIFKHVLKRPIPIGRLRCDMVHGLSLGLPAALGQLCGALRIDRELVKMASGKGLIRLFCKPRKPTKAKPYARATRETDPEDWAAFCEYNVQDVIAERAAYRAIERHPMPEQEWAYWELDQKINDNGFPIDRDLVDGALELAARHRTRLVSRARQITGLSNPNSVPQLRGWLTAQGVETKDLNKHTVETLLRGDLDPDVREVLEARQQLGTGSLKKFDALKRATSGDGRLRNCLQFYGASRTGRWAGRVFQPQNLPRGNLKPDELREAVEWVRLGISDLDLSGLSSCIRSAVRAPEGQLLRVADLANIESRILGWLCDCDRMLAVFADPDADIYKDFASELFHVPVDQIDKAQRTYAKPPTLGCGYGLGARGLVKYAEGMFVEMTDSEAQRAVDLFRSAYSPVPRMWKLLEKATKQTVRDGKTRKVGRLTFERSGRFLFMVLPSGRRLGYLDPVIKEEPAPWDHTKTVHSVTYMGLDQYTRSWCRTSTFGGKWVEQACQAISRDLLAHGMERADRAGFEIVGHTHDELIALSPEGSALDHDALSACMVDMPEWGDDKLFLGAEGFSDVIYRKD